uniref:Uncharacterized protein n=1 Tax=viral metagenome TaxID=1070528 RepID=A0A6C0AEN7_9ZZZZ
MKYKDIPYFLHNSEFYLNLDPLGEDFDIPFDIPEEIINNMKEFNKIYRTINFFGAKYSDFMKNYWLNNSSEIMKEYFDFTPENQEMFKQLISVNKIIKFYHLIPSDNYIQYGLKNKNEYIAKIQTVYQKNLKNI